MTFFSRAPDRPSGGIPSPEAVSAGLRSIATTLMNRRAARRLADLPDYLLHDLGLKRDDIHDALNRDWRDDPTFRLAIAAARRRRAP